LSHPLHIADYVLEREEVLWRMASSADGRIRLENMTMNGGFCCSTNTGEIWKADRKIGNIAMQDGCCEGGHLLTTKVGKYRVGYSVFETFGGGVFEP
jgi:hypothetical protein